MRGEKKTAATRSQRCFPIHRSGRFHHLSRMAWPIDEHFLSGETRDISAIRENILALVTSLRS